MKLTFFGGAKEVTGANYLLETGGTRILIDCGVRQGGRFAERENFEKFPYDPAAITGVCVTHAHIDHTGRLPSLLRAGFTGTVYSTPPTKDFAEHLLLDSEHIMSREAEDLGVPPPYTAEDIIVLMTHWHKIPYRKEFTVGPFTVEFRNAGHILGSASIRVTADGKTIVFSGDLGNMPPPFIAPTEDVGNADYALIESAYGDRVHEDEAARKNKLEDVIEETASAGGALMIPAFALERTQDILFILNELVENGRVPRIPVFLDSPLAIKLTSIYQKYASDPMYFNTKAIAAIRRGDIIFDFPGLRLTLTTEQSKEIAAVPGPKIVIAGAGMSNGGRILHHEKRYLPDPNSTILFIGYQVRGSRGRQILDGAPTVSIHKETIPIRCRREAIGGYSAHADQPQLLRWMEPLRNTLKTLFIVQGEEGPATALALKARDRLAINAYVPSRGETIEL
ncbi:MAG: MBL fold metallo-hydrolase [Candidatus Liptonbacteria bacterium]|nr:MBL fold metallo-hydrolase [Candidatus Liptonbacteria bacterium]